MKIAHRREIQDNKGDHGGGMKGGERSIYEVYKKKEQWSKVKRYQKHRLKSFGLVETSGHVACYS